MRVLRPNGHRSAEDVYRERVVQEAMRGNGEVSGCSSHLADVAGAVKKRGFWSYVNAPNALGFAARWRLGTSTKDELDPFVISLLEIRAKAERMGLRSDSPRCPMCAIAVIAKDQRAPGKIIEGCVDLAIQVMTTNGHRSR